MKLFYFTHSYPYGLGEEWKTIELRVLARMFDEVLVVPFCPDGNKGNPKPLPDGVRATSPLFEDGRFSFRRTDLARVAASPHRVRFVREFLARRVYLHRPWLREWATASLTAGELVGHPEIRRLLTTADKDSVFYFYWGRGSCEMMPLVAQGLSIRKSCVRMHRYDVFEYVNDGYIPYRRQLLSSISLAAPVSEAGKQHLDALYPEFSQKVRVFRNGSVGNGKRTQFSTDGTLRVVSCSLLRPVKRVDLMIDALTHIDFPIEWHHVGDGPLRDELELRAEKNHVRDRFVFHGMLDSRRVLDFYTDRALDVFVNVSSSEGIPAAIKEAFSTGLPVLATDVGGTSELVDDKTGWLLPANVTARQLAQALATFRELGLGQRAAMADAAIDRHRTCWDGERLAAELGEYLVSP